MKEIRREKDQVLNAVLQTEGLISMIKKGDTNLAELMVEGVSSKEIADKLCASIHTVSTHRKNNCESWK